MVLSIHQSAGNWLLALLMVGIPSLGETPIRQQWVAPDGQWVVIENGCWPPGKETCSAGTNGLSLTLVNRQTHKWRLVSRTDTPPLVSWAPDSKGFFLVEHISSDRDDSYAYNVDTERRVDLGSLISGRDMTVKHYQRLGSHLYFRAERWRDPKAIEVEVTGHTDSLPVKEFHLRFLITLDSEVIRLS